MQTPSFCSAPRQSIRGKVSPFLGLVTGTPLASRAASIADGVRVGTAVRRSAAQPAACGEAWLVPKKVARLPPRKSDRMAPPGAKRSVVELLSVKQVTRSACGAGSVQEAGGPNETEPKLAS